MKVIAHSITTASQPEEWLILVTSFLKFSIVAKLNPDLLGRVTANLLSVKVTCPTEFDDGFKQVVPTVQFL
jgi:hypothetical protein